MNKECNVVRDLIPLYVENMISEDTKEFVDKHVAGCESCAQFLEELKAPDTMYSQNYEEQAVPIKKVKKKLRNIILAIVAVAVIIAVGIGFVFGSYEVSYSQPDSVLEEWEYDYFSEEERKALDHNPSSEEETIAKQIIKEAEDVFLDTTHTSEEADQMYGALSRYAIDSSFEVEYVSYHVDYLGCEIKGDEGYVWVNYSNAGYKDNKSVTGSWNVNACWKINKSDDGKWVVVDVREHP